jgi:hypothetical protein
LTWKPSGRFDPVESECLRPREGVICSLHETVVGIADAEQGHAKTARHLPDAGKLTAFDQKMQFLLVSSRTVRSGIPFSILSD